MILKTTSGLALTLLLLSACTVNYSFDFGEDEIESVYFEEEAKPVNKLLVFGPQPTKNDLTALKENNIQKVISFRTPTEIEELDYQQAAELESLGIEFTNIPVGGDDFPYSPDVYQSLVNELDSVNPDNGRVLLHCKSGWRASVAGVAYLVKHEGMPLSDATEFAVGWWPLPLEKVLDTELELIEKP